VNRGAGRIAAFVVIVASMVMPAGPATAHTTPDTPSEAKDRQREITGELKRLEGELDEVMAEEAELVAAFNTIKARRDRLDGELARLDQRLAGLEATLGAAQDELDAAQARYLNARRRLELATAELRRARQVLRDQAIDAYTGTSGLQLLSDALLGVRSFEELNTSTVYLEAVLDAQAGVVERHTLTKGLVTSLTASLDDAKVEAVERRDDVAAQHQQLLAAKAEQSAVRAEADAEARREAELIADARSRRAAYERRVDDLKQESSSIAALIRRHQGNQSVLVGGSGLLTSPVPGARITSYFGPRVHPIFGSVRTHTGLDFGASFGTPVRSAAAGEILFTGWRGGYGNTVIIDHGGSLATLYAHLSSIAATPGQVVAVGDVIGRVGSTGYSTGPHLHFEVRVAGNPVDPLKYL
jgi:murein DD-endopeptidase MepM/ murein hydrolase activator NlpD